MQDTGYEDAGVEAVQRPQGEPRGTASSAWGGRQSFVGGRG